MLGQALKCWEAKMLVGWVGSEQMPNGQAYAMSRTQARIGKTGAEEGRLSWAGQGLRHAE
jgi:hypothetical protein